MRSKSRSLPTPDQCSRRCQCGNTRDAYITKSAKHCSFLKRTTVPTINRGIIFPLHERMKMIRTLSLLERRARYLMGIFAISSVLAVLLYKTGLVATEPRYDEPAWYSFSKYGGFVISTEHDNEAACRSAEKLSAVICRSGKSLMTNVHKDPFNQASLPKDAATDHQ